MFNLDYGYFALTGRVSAKWPPDVHVEIPRKLGFQAVALHKEFPEKLPIQVLPSKPPWGVAPLALPCQID